MKCYVKFFREVRTQTRNGETWVDEPPDGHASGEDQINAWIDLAGVFVKDVRAEVFRHLDGDKAIWTVVYSVTYSTEEPGSYPMHVDKQFDRMKPKSNIPLVPASVTYGNEKRDVKAQAGLFGVPPGSKMHQDDREPAPTVLLSPAFKKELYGDLFE
jgi:hypothetical protein